MAGDAESPTYTADIERLIRRLSDTERELQDLAAGELDAVVDRVTATTILLKGAQNAISKSEVRFRDLIDRCPALVCEISPDGTTLFANTAGRTFLGYNVNGWGDLPSWTSLVPDTSRSTAMKFIAAVQKGNVTDFELPVRASNGDVRTLSFNTANRYDGNGELEMIVAFGIDITERKKAEESARRLADAMLAQAQAEAANKAKTDFLAVMSHELRTPLNAIGGYAELIEMGLRGPVTQEQLDDLGRIRRSQRHLLGLINEIMNFARLEAGHVSLRVADVSVNDTLSTLDMLTEPQVATKGIHYLSEPCDPGLTMWADSEKARQILINLVSNALKFTPSGGTIEVKCVTDDQSVHFHVCDTGRGIPAAKLEEIFEPFVQVNKQFTREDGVGLGLAISRDLARLMDGDLTVESTELVGSHFTLTLPRSRARAD